MSSDWFAEVKPRVEDRLAFVAIIGSLNAQIATPGIVPRKTPEGLADHPWLHFDALQNYLLLTCFDILGQNPAFTGFPEWLKGRRHASEREAAICKIRQGADPAAIAETLHRAYLNIYGVRVSFFRFIDEILNSESRKELLESVRILKGDIATTTWTSDTIEPGASKNALFHLRNVYTHSGISIGNLMGGIIIDWYKAQASDAQTGYYRVYREVRGGVKTEYLVRRWPVVLIETVRAGLAAIEAKDNAEFSLVNRST